MKNVLALSLVSLFSVASLAAETPISACRVKHRGEVIDVTDGNKFFQTAHNIAQRENVCIHAKIAFVPNSGRVYSGNGNGKLLATISGQKKDLSNAEALEAAYLAGESCAVLSCDEIGVLNPGEPFNNEIPNQLPPIEITIPSSGGY